MRKYSRLVTSFAALAAIAAVAPAQARQDVHLVARVPFAFTVGTTTLPSDTYYLSRMNEHRDVLLLRGDRTGAIVYTNEQKLPRSERDPSLVFHRYGDQYFLREIQWEDTSRLDVPETKAERKAAETRAGRAAVPMKTVMVAAGKR
jgi:hypothetical protein